MAVPTSGNFKMFDTSSATSIKGAISGAGKFNVNEVDDFGNLIANTYAWQFDPTYAGEVINPVVDVYKSSQFRNFPVSASAPTPPSICCYTWTSIDTLTTGRNSMASAGESGTSTLVWSGDCSNPTNITEAYDGSTWSSQATLTFCYSGMSGTGEQNAALGVSGIRSGQGVGCANQHTVEYNGTSWSITTSNNTMRSNVGVAGDVNTAVMFGGFSSFPFPYGTFLTCTEEYNGTSWSAGCSLPSARARNLGVGFQGNALSIGGFGSSTLAGAVLTCTEEYNGTSWASGGTLPTARQFHAGGGDYNDAIVFGGTTNTPGYLSSADLYNGISWSNTCAMINSRASHGGAGNTANSTAAGGLNSGNSYLDTAECYGATPAGVSDGWYAGGDLNLGRMYGGSAGLDDAMVFFGGGCTRPRSLGAGTRFVVVSNTEEYNGSSWSNSNLLNNRRSEGGGTGTQNAALFVAGKLYDATLSNTEEYNGTTWSSTVGLGQFSYAGAATGTQNAALYSGGKCASNGNVLNCTLEYDGTSWSFSPASMNTARYAHSAGGTQNTTLAVGGTDNSIYLACTEEYNGTSWSTAASMAIGNGRGAGGGDSSCFINTGGVRGNNLISSIFITATTERYNGTTDAWASGASLPAYRYGLGGANDGGANANCFLVMGGSNGAWPYTWKCTYRYFTN